MWHDVKNSNGQIRKFSADYFCKNPVKNRKLPSDTCSVDACSKKYLVVELLMTVEGYHWYVIKCKY